ncbi:MAG: glycosyltransferase family 2 protein [Odoribacter sp.]|nr:glycosyltransferase family 2 protein [Odoribacter sp.]
MAGVAVVILNWNGEKLLKEYLPSVVRHTSAAWARVVVVDNASTDASLDVLQREFPQVERVCFEMNYGFAGGYNKAIELLDEEIVVLLNSDVEVAEGWLEPLVAVLKDCPDVAAVQPKIKSWKEKTRFEYAGACGGFIDELGFPFCRGRMLEVVEEDAGQYDDAVEVFWCSGAALCIRRKAYLDAGGLDERFFAHMEEIDLCWRLRNAGWRLRVCPQAVVYHLGGGSLPMNHPRKLFLNYRNNLLMLYKNLTPDEWRRVSRRRKGLDFLASLVFLLKGEMKNVTAVFRAYREFYAMKKAYRQPESERLDPCVYRGSIIFQYYFRRVRTFSRLWK